MSGRLVCWKCHQPISPGQQFLNAVGHTWHEQCFSCRNCSRSLGTGEFYTVNSEPFCAQCHVTQDVPNCAKCHQPVHRGVDFLKYEGNSYHARCFTCEGCSRELSTADFFKVDGRRYCSPCSDNMTSQGNSYSGGYSSNPSSYGNSSSSPSSNRNSSPYSNSGASSYGNTGASSYGSGSGASSYGSGSSPSSYGNNSSSSSYAAAKPVSTYGGYNDNPTSSYGSNKPTSTYGSSSSSYAAAKPVSSYDSFNDDHHNHNDYDNNDYSAEISIGVVPTSDTMTASHHATHHDHDDYNDHHNDHHGHDNHHHNGEENGNEDQSDLNALVRELESSGSDFNSKYGGSGYQAGGNKGEGADESDPLAAALRSLQEFDDH